MRTEEERCLYRLLAFSFNFQCIAVAKKINGAVTLWTAVLPTILLLWQTDVYIMSGQAEEQMCLALFQLLTHFSFICQK